MKNNRALEIKELSVSEIEQVSGGSQTMTVATSWAGTVAGFAAGAIIGGPIGGAIGAFVGFAVGTGSSSAFGGAMSGRNSMRIENFEGGKYDRN